MTTTPNIPIPEGVDSVVITKAAVETIERVKREAEAKRPPSVDGNLSDGVGRTPFIRS